MTMLDIVNNTLQRFKDEVLESDYEILLEADVVGWLFHLLIQHQDINPEEVHLETRVCNSKRRYDIAIGPVNNIVNPRPCIQPQLVAEVKIFPRIGFNGSQHGVHYKEILDRDLPKLGELDKNTEFRMALILDGDEYFKGRHSSQNRREFLINSRNKVAPGVHLFIIHLEAGNWKIDPIPP